MNILDEIVSNTKSKLEHRKIQKSFDEIYMEISNKTFQKSIFKESLTNKTEAIIAEIKKASPSAGIISKDFDPVSKAKEYEALGASALSVLTEEDYFLGSTDYLKAVREISNLPILRKDFIVDEYQIYESKLIEADCILLIVSILSDIDLKNFSKIADNLGLDYIMEVHDKDELLRVSDFENAIIGVNNRNLKTFEVDIKNSITLRQQFNKDNIFVSESGIKSKKDIEKLKENNISVFLIGESLMNGDFFET